MILGPGVHPQRADVIYWVAALRPAKPKRLLTLLAAGTLISLAGFGPVTAQAPSTQGGGMTTTSGTDNSASTDTRRDHDTNFRWLGLLGLAGLCKPRREAEYQNQSQNPAR